MPKILTQLVTSTISSIAASTGAASGGGGASGNSKILVSGVGAKYTSSGYTFFNAFTESISSLYDPDSMISNGQITLTEGSYLITVSCDALYGGYVKINVFITPSGGTKTAIRQNWTYAGASNLTDMLLVASEGDVLEIEYASQYAANSKTDFTIKKVL